MIPVLWGEEEKGVSTDAVNNAIRSSLKKRSQKASGMSPVMEVSWICMYRKFVKPPNDDGIVPLIPVLSSQTSTSPEQLPISEGRIPEMSVSASLRFERVFSDPRVEGMLPDTFVW